MCVPLWQDKLYKATEQCPFTEEGYKHIGIDSRWFLEWERIAVEKVVIHACQTEAGESAGSDGGRFKGQAARVTHSG